MSRRTIIGKSKGIIGGTPGSTVTKLTSGTTVNIYRLVQNNNNIVAYSNGGTNRVQPRLSTDGTTFTLTGSAVSVSYPVNSDGTYSFYPVSNDVNNENHCYRTTNPIETTFNVSNIISVSGYSYFVIKKNSYSWFSDSYRSTDNGTTKIYESSCPQLIYAVLYNGNIYGYSSGFKNIYQLATAGNVWSSIGVSDVASNFDSDTLAIVYNGYIYLSNSLYLYRSNNSLNYTSVRTVNSGISKMIVVNNILYCFAANGASFYTNGTTYTSYLTQFTTIIDVIYSPLYSAFYITGKISGDTYTEIYKIT